MAECRFRDHRWVPTTESTPDFQRVTLRCFECGVGHFVEYRPESPRKVAVALTVFPATGQTTVSRDVIRWSVMTHVANVSDMRDSGVEVIEGQTTIDGIPTGD